MDEWIWTPGLAPAFDQLRRTGPAGSAPPSALAEPTPHGRVRSRADEDRVPHGRGARIRSAECGGGRRSRS